MEPDLAPYRHGATRRGRLLQSGCIGGQAGHAEPQTRSHGPPYPDTVSGTRPTSATPRPHPPARWVAWLPAGNLAFGLCWVLGTDALLRGFAPGNTVQLMFGSTLKGVVFVVLTTALLQLALRFGLDPVRRPASPGEDRVSASAAPAVVLAASFVLIAACAWAVVQREIADIRSTAEEDVRAMAALKASQVESWYQSNVGVVEGLALSHDTVFDVDRRREGGVSQASVISERVHGLRGGEDFLAVQVYDASGREVSRTGTPFPDATAGRSVLRDALRERRIATADLLVDPRDGGLRMQVAAPLRIARPRGAEVVGALLVTIDARDLLTGLGDRPISNEPIETLLVRSDGDTVRYVSARDSGDTQVAVLEQRPAEGSVVGARVLGGETGPFEARRSSGVQVLAAGAAVPGSPWHVAVMLDTSYIDDRITGLMVRVASLVLVSIATVVTLALLWWHAERRRSELVLQRADARAEAAEARLGWISDFANDAILLIAEDGRTIDANKAALGYYGRTREEMLGMRIGDLRTPQDRSSGEFARQFAEALGRGRVVFETVHVRKDGTRFPVEVSACRVEYRGRHLVQSIVRDITERRRQEDALARSEARYRAMFDAVPYPMCVHDLDSHGLLLANLAAAAEYGYDRDEFRRLSIVELVAPAERPRMLEHIHGLAGIERSLSGIWRSIRKDGTEFDVEVVSHPLTFDGRAARIVIAADVTDRLRAERALAQSEEHYRILFHSNPHPMWVFDAETLRFLTVNDAATANYGYSEAEFLAMSIEDIRPLDEVPRLKEQLLRNPATTTTATGTWKHRRRDGTLIDVEVITHGLEYDGRPARLVLAHDVTRRLATERELRDSENRYRTLFEQIPDGVAHAGIDGRVLAANDAWLRMLGYTREDLGTTCIPDVLAPDEAPRFATLLEAARLGGNEQFSRRERWGHRRRDGSEFAAEVSSRLLADGTMLGVVRDLTEQIATEHSIEVQRDTFELLTLGNQAMARATTRTDLFRSIVELLVERGGHRLAWFGEVVGDAVMPVVWHGRQDGHLEGARATIRAGRSPSGGELARLLRTGMATTIQDTSTYPNLLVSEDLGRRMGVRSIAMVPICTRGLVTHGLLVYADRVGAFEPGVLRGLEELGADVAFALDLLATRDELADAHAGLERKVAERTHALEIERDRAEAADRAKSAFLGSVSHELRSPLHSILGFTSVLLEQIDGSLNAPQFEHLRVVRDSGQSLLGLINDLIDISRLGAGQIEIERQPFSPAASLRKSFGQFRAAAEAKGLTMNVEWPAEDVRALGDAQRFEQALGKLLSNAVLYTDQGGVTVRCHVAEAGFSVAVSDTGPGISERDQAYLFQRFTQLDPGHGRLRQGTGLGLAIAYGLAVAMGGTLACDSAPGRGSTFTLTVPLYRGPDPAPQP